MIEVKIVADSVGYSGCRLTTFVLTYPRFIHSEVMTHRMFSRNAASSRAIPVQKMIEKIGNEPAIPVEWGRNGKGMQAKELINKESEREARNYWLKARDALIEYAQELLKLGVHKQIANRLLEPFAHMTTIVTATDYGNFFNLRAHPDAQPEFQELAYQMLAVYKDNVPQYKKVGQWHLPFADKYLPEGLSVEELLKISTARAARVSYLNFEGDIDHLKDYKLHDDLATSGHWSPFEHPAQLKRGKRYYGNFRSWKQYRKFFNNENQFVFDASTLLNKRGKHA
jgi:thymidylate synthase ThyX